MSEPNMVELLDRWRSGDEPAGHTIMQHYVDVYANPLLVYLRSLGVRTDDAEDIRQEAFLRFFLRLREDFTILPGCERKYLFTIARNRVIDRARKRSDTRGDRHMDVPDNTEKPEKAIIKAETKEDIQRALSRLPENQRRIIEMYDYDGLTFKEISEVLRIPISTAWS